MAYSSILVTPISSVTHSSVFFAVQDTQAKYSVDDVPCFCDYNVLNKLLTIRWLDWLWRSGSGGRRVAVCDVRTWIHGPGQLRSWSALQSRHRPRNTALLLRQKGYFGDDCDKNDRNKTFLTTMDHGGRNDGNKRFLTILKKFRWWCGWYW